MTTKNKSVLVLCMALSANVLAESGEEIRKKFQDTVTACTAADQTVTRRSTIIKTRPDSERPTPEEAVELRRMFETVEDGYDPFKMDPATQVFLKMMRKKLLWTFHIEPVDTPAAAETKTCLEKAMTREGMLAEFE